MNKGLDHFLSIVSWVISLGGFFALLFIQGRSDSVIIAICLLAWLILVAITFVHRKNLGYATILVFLSIVPWLTLFGLVYLVSKIRFLQ